MIMRASRNDFQGIVGLTTVYENVLNIAVALGPNALDRGTDSLCAVAAGSHRRHVNRLTHQATLSKTSSAEAVLIF